MLDDRVRASREGGYLGLGRGRFDTPRDHSWARGLRWKQDYDYTLFTYFHLIRSGSQDQEGALMSYN